MSYFTSSQQGAGPQSAQDLIREHLQRMVYYSSINFTKDFVDENQFSKSKCYCKSL